MVKRWFRKRGRKGYVSPLSEDTTREGNVEVSPPRLSLLSFTHPEEDAPSARIYCGRLFARKAEKVKQETYEHLIALLYDGSDEDLTLKIIDLIVEMGYQHGYILNIDLDALREPIPEAFLKAFDDH